MTAPITIPELASRLRLSDRFVRARVVSGEWPCHRFGALYRFTEDDVAAIFELTSRPAVPVAPAAARGRLVGAERIERARAVKAARAQGRRRTAAG